MRLSDGSAALHIFALPDPRDLQAPGRQGAPPAMIQRSGTASSAAQQGAGPTVLSSGVAGFFTAAQAARGQQVFAESCAKCHRIADQTGAAFNMKWANGGLGTLFDLIFRTMPENAGGSLSKSDYAAVIAYQLRESGYPAGASELPADPAALAKVQLPPR